MTDRGPILDYQHRQAAVEQDKARTPLVASITGTVIFGMLAAPFWLFMLMGEDLFGSPLFFAVLVPAILMTAGFLICARSIFRP